MLSWGGVGGQSPRIMFVIIYIHIIISHSELAGGGRGSAQYMPFHILNATPIDKKLLNPWIVFSLT